MIVISPSITGYLWRKLVGFSHRFLRRFTRAGLTALVLRYLWQTPKHNTPKTGNTSGLDSCVVLSSADSAKIEGGTPIVCPT